MTDVERLDRIIVESGLKKGFIAEQMHISRQTLSLKLRGRRAFNQYEIKTLCDLLGIAREEKEKIFFA